MLGRIIKFKSTSKTNFKDTVMLYKIIESKKHSQMF